MTRPSRDIRSKLGALRLTTHDSRLTTRRRLSTAALFLIACSEPGPTELRPPLASPEAIRTELSPLPFDGFVARSFEHLLLRAPETVIDLGLGHLDVGETFLDDISDDFTQETFEVERTILELLSQVDRDQLSPEQRITRDVYLWWLDDRVRDQEFADLEYLISPALTSVHATTEFFFTEIHPLESDEDAEAYVARLWRIRQKFAQLEETLIRREQAGLFSPRTLAEWALPAIRDLAESDPTSTPYHLALRQHEAGRRMLEEAEQAIADSVQPAYASLAALLERQLDASPLEDGVWQLPGGDAYYTHLLRHHTTLDVTADELHQLGLIELERIHAELDVHFQALGYAPAPLSDQIQRVIEDGGVVPSQEIVSTYEMILAEADARLDEAFDLRPSAELIVIGGDTGGYYLAAALDGSRPGAFYAAVSPRGEPRFGMRTLAYHEGVPGHHFSIGVGQDLALPLVRRLIGFTSFDEGWALYAEWLAGDLGWYTGDRYGDIGRLQAEAFRAARLVVDTGIHSQRWSFDEAVAFFEDNAGFSQGASQNQIARYVSWPGQSTAYYTGFQRFRSVRRDAEEALTDRFDVRAFHRAVLTEGSLPLSLIGPIVRARLGW